MTTFTNLLGTNDSVMTTELNSLANNALVASSAITITSTGFLLAEFELYIAGMGGTPTANTSFDLWLLRRPDGTNYEDGGASVTPTRGPDVWFPIRAVSTAQRIVRVCELPPGLFIALIRNGGTGQALAATANTLKVRPYTTQGL